MGRSRQLGMFLMIGAALEIIILVIGLMRRSYLVIALPVVIGTGIVSAMAFWVGWTMANTEPDLAELEAAAEVPLPV